MKGCRLKNSWIKFKQSVQMFFAFSVLKFTFSTFKKRLRYNERANCVNVIFIKVLFMEFIKSEPVIQFGNQLRYGGWSKMAKFYAIFLLALITGCMAQFPGEIMTFFSSEFQPSQFCDFLWTSTTTGFKLYSRRNVLSTYTSLYWNQFLSLFLCLSVQNIFS